MARKYVIYQRVSTDEQAEKGYNLDAMLEKSKHFIQSQEDATLVKVYEDRGYSGTLDPTKRPALNQLLNDVKDRNMVFDTVLVWKLDRLSRSLRDTLNINYMLSKANTTLESVTERIDSSSASGKMFFSLVAGFSEFESAQIGERTKNAMSSKVGQIRLGGKAPLGYKYVAGKLKIDHKQSNVIKKLFRYFLKVRNYSETGNFLNKKGFSTSCKKPFSAKKVRRILINPAYYGATAWNKKNNKLSRINPDEQWIIKEQTHNPIISKKMFQKVQALIKKRRSY